ncbi:hypothetical protein PLEOSDRAFT_1043789 [Pleurotus ostreatus PC15]|uniref:Sorting nexin MVP1 n=1 Tax=Pleurotus ostreatus (strain PC15) TaxID=1137138 RepID=A0A067NI48_PLEO1|nr:hypothetical protein PLEOSDRAFT_1043789 [Pleurotus ostreatus PC15]
MFNSPRPAQRYAGATSGNFGGSFVDDNPLASSVYDGLDPWSAAPSPSPPPIPPAASNTVFSSVIADATVPSIYNKAFTAVDPDGIGETSVNALSRVLGTSSLPAATIDKIVNLVSSRPRVSKLEFFVALALVALAQSGKDVSIEQVAALSSRNDLPEPKLDLSSLVPSVSTFQPPPPPTYRQNTTSAVAAPGRSPGGITDDPWATGTSNVRFGGGLGTTPSGSGFDGARGSLANGAPSSLAGTGLPKEWWKRQETVRITILGQQGFILNRYTVYEISTDRGNPVTRRYSEFVFLWECLTRRYPFRLFPALPPKRIGSDEYFLEQRRRGLNRALNFVINHPVIKEDGLLAVFLTEPSFETWRKHTSVSLDEESASKRVDRLEEMTIPSDLEDKLAIVRNKIPALIEQWQRICILAERIIKRREAAAVRIPFFPIGIARGDAHVNADSSFGVPRLFNSLASPQLDSSVASVASLPGSPRIDSSIYGGHGAMPNSMYISTANINTSGTQQQGDLSRLTNTLRAVTEVMEHSWRGEEDELSSGVRQGLGQVAMHCSVQAEIAELRTRTLFDTTLESLKSQRDLYIAMRDLFVRQDRLSIDQVDRLKKRVETTSVRLDGIKSAQKEGWQEEAEKLVSAIERDQATIAAQLARRIFIRACMWHELRVVFHNRENTMLTVTAQAFAREEHAFAERVVDNWASMIDGIENMPYE